MPSLMLRSESRTCVEKHRGGRANDSPAQQRLFRISKKNDYFNLKWRTRRIWRKYSHGEFVAMEIMRCVLEWMGVAGSSAHIVVRSK